MFLYGTIIPPANFLDSDLTKSRDKSRLSIDTDAFLDAETGPGRFVVASNSTMIERFFETGAADYAAGLFNEHKNSQTGVVSMNKSQLKDIYGPGYFGILVDNKDVYDSLDDYAARVYIYGNIELMMRDLRSTLMADWKL